MSILGEYLKNNELWLMERILYYAKRQGYTAYTSTLVEAWRVSIVGLTDAIIVALEEIKEGLPEFSPHDILSENSIAEFGIKEARLHRERGISLQMFLGLYKYYRYSFIDLVRRMKGSNDEILHNEKFVERSFDLIEIAFCSEWAEIDSDNKIIELQSSNRKMTNEKNKYLTLFESLGFPAYLIETDGTVTNMNSAAIKSLGIKAYSGSTYYGTNEDVHKLLVGKKILEIMPWLSDALTQFMSGNSAVTTFEHFERTDEDYNYYSVNLARMKDVSGKFEGAIVTIEDITHQKQIEKELAHSSKLESIGGLASGVAHEINTPLQYIGNNLKFLKKSYNELHQHLELLGVVKQTSLSPTQKEELAFIISEVPNAILESINGIEHVTKIVQALKKTAHPNNSALRRIHLGEVFESVAEVCRNEWKHVAEVKINYDKELNLIEGFGGDIFQIALNLILNASQAIRERQSEDMVLGLINLVARNSGPTVEMLIQDDGCGIPEAISHRIFDPFFTTKEVGQGTGQGLNIVHTLVSKNHGKISFSSKEGEGTTFIVQFPKATCQTI